MSKSGALAVLCSVVLIVPPPHLFAWTQSPAPPSAQPSQPQQALSAGQLDSLVAPLALYPDPLLSQVLVAATYPLEIVQAEQWLEQNKTLTGKPLAAAAAKQTWDASVQALVMFPDLLKQLSNDVNWVSDLGNAFLADEGQVMAAIQRMRQKAEEKGMLQSNQQQTVTSSSENGQNYIVIEPAQPEVIYVPQYDPAAVWGAPAYYPYPPIAYPPASNLISFGAGLALGAIWGGGGWGGWGWGMGWGGGNVTINNNFISRNNFNRVNVGNGNRWQHNPSHRGNVPYRDRGTANRYRDNGGNRPNTRPRPTPRDTERRLGQGGANRLAPDGRGGGVGRGNAGREGMNRPGAGRGSQPGARPGQGGAGRGGANRVSPGTRPSTGGSPRIQNPPSRGGANRAMPSGGGHRGGGGGGARMGGGGGHRGGGGGGARMGGGGGGHRGGGGGRRR